MIRRASAVAIAVVLNATPLFGQSVGTPASELTVKGASADVHKGPTMASPVIGTARGGTVLDITRNLGIVGRGALAERRGRRRVHARQHRDDCAGARERGAIGSGRNTSGRRRVHGGRRCESARQPARVYAIRIGTHDVRVVASTSHRSGRGNEPVDACVRRNSADVVGQSARRPVQRFPSSTGERRRTNDDRNAAGAERSLFAAGRCDQQHVVASVCRGGAADLSREFRDRPWV